MRTHQLHDTPRPPTLGPEQLHALSATHLSWFGSLWTYRILQDGATGEGPDGGGVDEGGLVLGGGGGVLGVATVLKVVATLLLVGMDLAAAALG